jgi:hypothetical protein
LILLITRFAGIGGLLLIRVGLLGLLLIGRPATGS